MHDLGETSRTSIKLFYVNVNLPVDQRHYLRKMLVICNYLSKYVLKSELYALKLWGDYNYHYI